LRGTSSGRINCDIADKCKKKNEESYNRTLGDVFGRMPASIPRSVSHILNFGSPALITTNYDHVLEYAAKDRRLNLYVQYYDGLEAGFHVETPCLSYLHGRAPDDEGEAAHRLVLATSEFTEAYECDYEAMRFGNAYRFLLSTLPDADVLFLGYSLDEPLLRRTLEYINAIRRRNKRQTHWVMLLGRTPEPDADDPGSEKLVRRRRDEGEQILRAREHDVEVITYTTIGGNHRQLDMILERLSEIAMPVREDRLAVATVETTGAEPYDY
jgi:hypothetical protein